MNTFAFQAKCVVTEHPDGDCHFVAFADQEIDGDFYLMLQRAFKHDEQDSALGMDTYYVEWCGQDKSGYGGISGFTLTGNGANVAFEPQAAVELNGMEHLSISFQLEQSEFRALRAALGFIFNGGSTLVVADA